MIVNWEIYKRSFQKKSFQWSQNRERIPVVNKSSIKFGESLGATKDSFRFTIPITDRALSVPIKINDRIEIYRSVNGPVDLDNESHFKFNGRVRSVEPKRASDEATIIIKGYSFSEAISDSVITAVDASNLTPPEMFKQVINSTRAEVGGVFSIEWDENNPDVKTNGEPFKKVGQQIVGRTLRYAFRKYSVTEFTGDDVSYYWYVDKNDKIIWRPMTVNPTQSFDARFDRYIELEQDQDTSQVINYVRVRAGTDLEGQAIEVLEENGASIATHGRKPKFVPTIAKNFQTLNTRDMDKLGYENRRYPKEEDYPFTTTWTDINNNTVVVGSDDEYNTKLRQYVQALARNEAQIILSRRRFTRDEMTLYVKPDMYQFGIGEEIDIVLPDGTERVLRVMKITYETKETKVELKEDLGFSVGN